VSEGRSLAPHPRLSEYYDDEASRRRLLDRLFDHSARDYDRIGRWMSFGSGEWYRAEALRRGGLRPGMKVLDVATGTGPVARAAARVVGAGNVVALDPSVGMLLQARTAVGVNGVRGLGERLPWRDGSFDFLSMGYALRHVADLRAAFAEYHRVLRPGGAVILLEIARPTSRLGYLWLRFYLGRVIPWLTRWRTKNRDAETVMRYFWDTIDRCVPAEEILAALADAGFEQPRRTTQLGMLAEYTARRGGAAAA
jgi:demethylmenaquinone methyltransferase/2-methoxy-6-polyprenyl-1,4-benzoquinol methylase